MKYSVELFHTELIGYKQFVNDVLIAEGVCNNSVTLQFDCHFGTNSVWFEPWGIIPKIRVNNFLVDPGLAGIDLFDHKFDIVLDKDFFSRYKEQDLHYRQASIDVNDAYIYDSVIGVGNLHKSLVDNIKEVMQID